MLAEAFAVVGNDDQPGVFENAALAKRVDQFANLFVEIGNAVVVGICEAKATPEGDTPALSIVPQ